jgi:hypothetical protein
MKNAKKGSGKTLNLHTYPDRLSIEWNLRELQAKMPAGCGSLRPVNKN